MINDLRLQYFRSYGDEFFEFDAGVNIIVGPNGSGKTNLLEAVLVNAVGGSYRARDGELIKFGKQWARIDSHADDQQRVVKLTKNNELVSKQFEVDGTGVVRLPLSKRLPIVLFEPDHLQLIAGGPELRRTYVDDLLEQTTPGFGQLRRKYKRALSQRNSLLKQTQSNNSGLFAWNIRLSELGGQIAGIRQKLITYLGENLAHIYTQLAQSQDRSSLIYVSKCRLDNYADSMLQLLEKHQHLDYERGFTGDGPHRDDVQIHLNNRAAEIGASRGEIRTLLLGLKIAEIQLMEQARSQKPVLLLDDVFSELDGKRRRALTEALSGYQAFITTTDADVVVEHFMDRCHIIPVNQSS